MSFVPDGSLRGMSKTTHVIEHAQADITYDVHGPVPTAAGRPPLMMVGQPMAASGFARLPRPCLTGRSSPMTPAAWAAAPARRARRRSPTAGGGHARLIEAVGEGRWSCSRAAAAR